MLNSKQDIISTPTFLGNDIACLTSADNIKSFSYEKYLKKILNQVEWDYYLQSGYKSSLPPLFWSCKESTYKILLQMGLRNSFSPRLFHVDLMLNEMPSVNHFTIAEAQCYYKNFTFFCRSSIEKDFIHTYASPDIKTLDNIVVQAVNLQKVSVEIQSEITYKLLLQSISEHYSLKYTDLYIKKDIEGAPSIYLNNLLLNIPFSVSHDENCVAFVFLKNKF